MRIDLHQDRSSPEVWLATHASNGAILATGKSREAALDNVVGTVLGEYQRLLGRDALKTLLRRLALKPTDTRSTVRAPRDAAPLQDFRGG